MNDVITIDPNALVLARDNSGDLTLTAEARHELQKVLDFKKLADEVYAYVEQKLGDAMDEAGLKKLVAGNVTVSRRLTGERFEIVNKNQVGESFIKKVVYVRPDADAIEKFVEETGQVPAGVAVKERNKKTTLAERTNI